MSIHVRQLVVVAGAGAAALVAGAAGCARVSVDPIQVQTIHIVHDVNIRVDRTLDEFFAFQEQHAAATTNPVAAAAAATQPAAGAAAAATTSQTTTQAAAAAGDVK